MAILFSGSAYSASLEVVSSDSLLVALSGTKTPMKAYANVKNVSSESIGVVVGLKFVQKTTNQQIQICYGNVCYGYFPSAKSPYSVDTIFGNNVTLKPGQTLDDTVVVDGDTITNAFDAVLKNRDTVGETVVIYSFYNSSNKKDFVSTTITYRITPTGTEEESTGSATGASVYPNPSSNVVTIEHSATDGILNIFSSDGSLVESRSISSQSTTESVSTSGYVAGSYFFTITSGGATKSHGKFQIVR
jgi:hypothetical protein